MDGIRKWQFMPIHQISNALGIPVCEALQFVHSFSGCDTTFSFAGSGKKTFCVWKIYPDSTAIFRKLSKGVPEFSGEDLQLIEKFVVSQYIAIHVIPTELMLHNKFFSHKENVY